MRYIVLLFILMIDVYGDKQIDRCKQDLINITHFYYLAIQMNHTQKYEESIKFYKRSSDASYLALESCKDKENFDFRPMYDYIIRSEEKIYEIESLD